MAPLFSLLVEELAAAAVLLLELEVATGAGAETTGATTLGCVEGAVLPLVAGATTISAIVEVAATDDAVATGSIATGGGSSFFNASI